MKKFTSFFATIAIALMSLSLVSCDDDEVIADTLWGTWEGNMYVQCEYNGHYYTATSSIIHFDKDYEYATSGTGYWIDYYSGAPWDYYASHIRWRVSDEVLLIHSLEDDTYFRIYDYSLSDRYFSGMLEGEDGTYMDFRLVKTSSPYWDDYEWGWGYYGYPDYAPRKDIKYIDTTNTTGGKMPRRVIRKNQ